jgi:hypothetical protein
MATTLGFGTQFAPVATDPFAMMQWSGYQPPMPPNSNGITVAAQQTAPVVAGGGAATQVPGQAPVVPGATAPVSWWGEGGKMEGFASIMDGLASLGEVYGALQGVKLGREQLAFQKSSYATNLANSEQSYNTSLENDITGAYSAREQAANPNLVDDYLKKHSL